MEFGFEEGQGIRILNEKGHLRRAGESSLDERAAAPNLLLEGMCMLLKQCRGLCRREMAQERQSCRKLCVFCWCPLDRGGQSANSARPASVIV